MAEWLFEQGIGEDRAALVENGGIVAAEIELPGLIRVGAVAPARLTAILIPGRRGIAELADGGEVLVEPLPPGVTQGATVRVRITREAGLEQGRSKRPKGLITDEAEQAGPSLRERLSGIGTVVELPPTGRDRLEAAGWSELLDEATSGYITFSGGALRMSLTPAMTLFDVDGMLSPAELAVAGAAAAGRAIRRFGIGGSIGIDLPTLPGKAERQAAAGAFDAALPQPFERTAVNGFGFLQIIRRRERASLPELQQRDPAGAAARALLRRAERACGSGPRTLHAAPAVIAAIEANPEWIEALARRIGAIIALRPEPGLAISTGHVHSHHP